MKPCGRNMLIKKKTLELFGFQLQHISEKIYQINRNTENQRTPDFLQGDFWDLLDKTNFQGGIESIIENCYYTAIEYAQGIDWKAIIPSEEDIKAALDKEVLTT